MNSYGEGYDHGWNDALDALIDRLSSADATLGEHIASRDGGFNDADKVRLRGKKQGVRLALDYIRGMAREAHMERGGA